MDLDKDHDQKDPDVNEALSLGLSVEDLDDIFGPIEPPDPEITRIQAQAQEFTPSLNNLRTQLQDPSYLPTREEILKALPTDNDYFDYFRDFTPKKAGEKTWSKFKSEILNNDHLEALALYISQQIEQYGASADNPLIILELGSGNGRLAHFLRQKLEKIAPRKTTFIATDSRSWDIEPLFPVEKLDHLKALQKYRPSIVIFSWMPPGLEASNDIRRTPSVREYILIGEPECCGDQWETYGDNTDRPDLKENGAIPPYIKDGFSKTELKDLSDLQMDMSDYRDNHFHSKTISFKRQ